MHRFSYAVEVSISGAESKLLSNFFNLLVIFLSLSLYSQWWLMKTSMRQCVVCMTSNFEILRKVILQVSKHFLLFKQMWNTVKVSYFQLLNSFDYIKLLTNKLKCRKNPHWVLTWQKTSTFWHFLGQLATLTAYNG